MPTSPPHSTWYRSRQMLATLLVLSGAFSLQLSAADLPAPAPGATAPAAPADETLQLSVFEVAADRDDSYGSATSTSITGTRKELKRIPVSAEVMGRALLDDIAVVEIREMLEYAPGVGAGIISGGSSDVQGNQPGDRIGGAVGSLRGLSVSTRRNGFLSNGSSFDGFNKDRIEIIRGPQALLYGPTNASGIIVINTKRPSFAKNTVRLLARTDSEGSLRGELEFNATGRLPFRDQSVAVLISGFRNHDKFWRVNNEIKSQAYYIAGAWKLSPRVTLRADFENIRRHSVDPTTIRLSAPVTNATYGSRSNEPLRLLIRQGRAGDIFNGRLNYANADAFGTDAFGEVRSGQIFSTQIEAEVTKWFSLLIQAGTSSDDRIRYNSGGAPALTPPGVNNNPTGDWAVFLTPNVDPIRNREKAYRALANFTLPEFRFVKSEFSIGGETRRSTSRQMSERWYELDANGQFIRNPALINNGNSGRTLMGGLWWAPGSQGFDGPPSFRSPVPDVVQLDGKNYRRDRQRNNFPELVTPENPRGFAAGSGNINYTRRTNDGIFAALSSAWFDERLDTLAGYRYDWIGTSLEPRPQDDRSSSIGTYLLGVNYHLTKNFTPYYAHSTSFQPSLGVTILAKATPDGSGKGDETGLKFAFLDNKITGSISVYSSQAVNNTANIPQEVLNIVDPNSNINRRNGGGVYVFDRETKGYEINVTAAPLKGLRIQASFSHIAANEGGDVILPILYNDQFNTNAAGQVTFGGTPLSVPINIATTGYSPLNPTPGVPTQVLTVAMLRNGDANGNYRAVINPNSGQITNAAALYLNTPGVGTGVSGLPVAQHQLGFVSPTGPTFLAKRGGDRNTGFASNSISVTTNYRFGNGWMKGLGLGSNVRQQLDQAAYYYLDRQTNPAAPERKLFFTPNQTLVNVFASYEFRFKRGYVLRTQLNVSNAFNVVNAIVYPDIADGTQDNVRLNNPPRVWTWTNSIRF